MFYFLLGSFIQFLFKFFCLTFAVMTPEEAQRTQKPYRYGMILLCFGALINWIGLAENYTDPFRYAGVACIIGGAFLICTAMCCWLHVPNRSAVGVSEVIIMLIHVYGHSLFNTNISMHDKIWLPSILNNEISKLNHTSCDHCVLRSFAIGTHANPVYVIFKFKWAN